MARSFTLVPAQFFYDLSEDHPNSRMKKYTSTAQDVYEAGSHRELSFGQFFEEAFLTYIDGSRLGAITKITSTIFVDKGSAQFMNSEIFGSFPAQ
jgi:hypothetical protein